MSSAISSDGVHLPSSYRFASDRLQKAMEQILAGKRLVTPGDGPVDYEEVSNLEFDKALDLARAQVAQHQVSWFQTAQAYLSEVNEHLTAMSETALKAQDPSMRALDREALDEVFQAHKGAISAIIDGEGGSAVPMGTFNRQPLFLGYGPDGNLGMSTLLSSGVEFSLFTGTGFEGFSSVPLLSSAGSSSPATLTGSVVSGGVSTMTLDPNGSAIDDVYKGMEVEIILGSGAGQVATIESYHGESRVVTFATPLVTPLDGSSMYRITSSRQNGTLEALPGVTSLSFASFVWGADNDRQDPLSDDLLHFRSLTDEEAAYRTVHGITDQDLIPKTYGEKMARRKSNIFDSEFGQVQTAEKARKMVEQVNGAIGQVSRLMTQLDARAAGVRQQYDHLRRRADVASVSVNEIGGVDTYENVVVAEEARFDKDAAIDLASKMSGNLSKLNDLVRNGGIRQN